MSVSVWRDSAHPSPRAERERKREVKAESLKEKSMKLYWEASLSGMVKAGERAAGMEWTGAGNLALLNPCMLSLELTYMYARQPNHLGFLYTLEGRQGTQKRKRLTLSIQFYFLRCVCVDSRLDPKHSITRETQCFLLNVAVAAFSFFQITDTK